MKLTNIFDNFIENFYNDVQIKKKQVSKFGKKTAYSSSSWSNSSRNVGFETLDILLEGVKKKNFHQNYKAFFNFFEIGVEISRDFSTK